jgi:uncharacterized membrane protein
VLDQMPLQAERETAPPAERRSAPDPTRRFLIAFVIVAAALRLWDLGANWLNYDESFTAMTGRLPLSGLFQQLRLHDSHPPFAYLLNAPFARAGADELLIRLPSALCSIAAVALFAWWMRRRGLVGVLATGLLAVSAFQLMHGREARMYAVMELVGVAAAVLADSWLQRPQRWHAPAIGALVMVGLLTHVSTFLLGAGLLLLAGRRRDRDAWRWRGALAAGFVGWCVLWGPSFVEQTRGGHSSWIPRTTLAGMVHAFGRLITYEGGLHAFALIAVAIGAWMLVRADRRLGRVWICCVLVPAALAALTGTVAPVLLDRTLTVASWGPLLAIGFLAAALVRHSRLVGAVAIVALVAVMVPPAVHAVTQRSNPDVVLRQISRVARQGDVVAIHPAGKFPEIAWSIGVRRGPYHAVNVPGLAGTKAIQLGPGTLRSGRTWVLDWSRRPHPWRYTPRCAPDWSYGGATLSCLVNAS